MRAWDKAGPSDAGGGGGGEEEEGLFKAKAMNEVDAGRDRATGRRIIQSKAVNEVRRMHN
jgi:hypothetical protein